MSQREEEFLEYVASRLHLVPRYRQKVVSAPLGLGRPRWIDDPHFDLRYHVRTTGLPHLIAEAAASPP